jgi:hypothetical protein
MHTMTMHINNNYYNNYNNINVVISSQPANEETGSKGGEIESRQGIGW